MNKIGEKIKEYRIKEGLTQKQLGDILYVTDKTISSWEICRAYPDIDMLKKISKALNLSMFELVYDNTLMKIFDAIGLVKIAKVSKRRTQYMYEDKYEFSFDKVDNLGYFVEVEVKKSELSLEEEYEKLIELVNKFNIDISKITTKRYPYYFIKS